MKLCHSRTWSMALISQILTSIRPCAQFISANNQEIRMSLQVLGKPVFSRNIFLHSIFNPFRCLIHMQSKWSFQPVKWEALCLLKFLIWISCFVLELSIWTVLPWLSFLTHLSDVWPHSLTPLSLIRVEQSLSCDKWNGENWSLKIYSV